MRIGSEGLTAYGLQKFVVQTGAGNDTLTVNTGNLNPSASGKFLPQGDFEPGDEIPEDTTYQSVGGGFEFDGGSGTDKLSAAADTDWTLRPDLLAAGDGSSLKLTDVEQAALTGGASVNVLTVIDWPGTQTLTLDGTSANDQYFVYAPALGAVTVNDPVGTLDSLTVLATSNKETIFIGDNVVRFGGEFLTFTGTEILNVAARGGDDMFVVVDSVAPWINLDGEGGSDLYQVFGGTTSSQLFFHDSGPLPPQNIDRAQTTCFTHPSFNYQVGSNVVRYDTTIEGDVCGPYIPDTPNLVPTTNNVTVREGDLAENPLQLLGGDPNSAVSFATSLGEVTNVNGQWIWRYRTVDNTAAPTTVTLTGSFASGSQTTASFTLTVLNVNPSLSHLAATSTTENDSTTLTGIITDPGIDDDFTLVIDWGDPISPNNTQTVPYPKGTTSFTLTHQYLDNSVTGSYPISLTIRDKDQGAGLGDTSVVVFNVPPELADLQTSEIDEDGTTTLAGRIVDPGTLDDFTLEINWGDPISPNNTELVRYPKGTTSFTLTHQYLQDSHLQTNGQYPVQLRIVDKDLGANPAGTAVTVLNVAPQVADLFVTPSYENGISTLSGRIGDPGTLDSFILEVNWGDPLSPDNFKSYEFGRGTTDFSVSHQYWNDNPDNTPEDTYKVALTIRDLDGGSNDYEANATVTNVAPTLIVAFTSDIQENEFAELTGTYLDIGLSDTHILAVEWGDPNNGLISRFELPAIRTLLDGVRTLASGDRFGSTDPQDDTELEILSIDPNNGLVEFRLRHQYLDDGPAPGNGMAFDESVVRVTILDSDQGSAEGVPVGHREQR